MAKRIKTVGDEGEERLIARIRRAVERSSLGDVARLGDDAAHLPPPPHRGQAVVSTDVLVQGTHWNPDHITARALGRRALVANLSDLAAMGATPHWFTLGLALEPKVPLSWFSELLRGLVDASVEFGCPLVGGDLVRSPTVSLAITVSGVCASKRIPSRFDAKIGDLICVTGDLGRAAMALELLQGKSPVTPRLMEKHWRPMPRIAEGIALAKGQRINAMMDISDGLIHDLPRLANLSEVKAIVDLEALPVRAVVEKHCAGRKRDSGDWAALSGEEFELLFTTSKSVPTLQRLTETPITVIGRIAEGHGVEWRRQGKRVKAPQAACHHFSQGRGR